MAALLAAWPAVVPAQQVPPLVVAGRVQKVRGADTTGVRGVRVILHRIGMSAQGPVDSVASDAAGGYRFRVTLPDTQSLYVVSVRYAGIGYFGEPVRGRAGTTGPATLTVYDTATAGPPLHTALRHLIVGPADEGGGRRLLDIIRVENPDDRTRVAADSLAPIWWTQLPEAIENPQVGEGEVAPAAARFTGDTVFVAAPFPPGGKQIVLTYDLPAGERRVALPVAAPTAEVEILVEGADASPGDGLVEQEGMTLEGRQFRRFTASNVAAGTVLAIRLGGSGGFPVRTMAIVLVALGMAGGLVLALRPRRGTAPAVPAAAVPPPHGPVAAADDADALLGRLVALDERYAEREASTPPAEWAGYQATRADLKARLARRVAPPPA